MDLPQNYADWKVCITQKCKITLTHLYVSERIQVLGSKDLPETQKFRALYGEAYLQSVLGCFKQAAVELSKS